MCGSTNQARLSAFAAAAAFFSEQTASQIGDTSTAPVGPTRKYIALVKQAGGPDAPDEIVALADAEDLAARLVREVQAAQQEIIGKLLSGGRVVASGSPVVEGLVASLNLLKDAVQSVKVAEAAADAAFGGVNTDGPVTLQ